MNKMLILLSSVVLLFSLLIIPASAAESDFSLTFYEAQSAESDFLLDAGTYVASFDFVSSNVSDWVSDPFEVPELFYQIPEAVAIYRDGEAVYEFSMESYEDVFIYTFYDAFDDSADDFSNIGTSVVVTFIPSEAGPDVPVKGESTAVAVSVFDVFAGVGSWIVTSLGSVSGLFWDAAAGNLTILGVLAISALAIGLVLGLVLIVSRWLRFRG